MLRISVIAGVLLTASMSPVGAQQILPVNHVVTSTSSSCAEPNRIVVQMPPPQVEIHDKSCSSDSSCKRCQLLPRLHKNHDSNRDNSSRDFAPSAQMLYTPASLPSMVIHSAPAAQSTVSPSLTQQITHDFSAIRNAQEVEARSATLEAQLAARNAMIKAENDYLCRIMERNQQRLQALASHCQAGTNGGGDPAGTALNTTLKNINERLDRIEELVLEHHRVLKSSNPLILPK